jgi:hypothetical protein
MQMKCSIQNLKWIKYFVIPITKFVMLKLSNYNLVDNIDFLLKIN